MTQQQVGAVIRQRRQELGLSLQRVADGAGCAKSLLSAVENGDRNPPGDEILRRIESVLALPPGQLVAAAAWQRGLDAGGAPVREGVAKLQDQQRVAQRLAELLKTKGEKSGSIDTLYRSGELRRLVDQLSGGRESAAASGGVVPIALPREVPLINKVAAGYPKEFTDLGYPARVADEYVRCPDLDDPDAFACRVVGDSMQPVYTEGDIVVFSPTKTVKSGMDCFARLEPDHESTFKRVYLEHGKDGEELIRLQPLNSAYPPRVVGREQVAGLYAAVSVMRKIV
ncbi:MAG TPA: LexA family transcriptional regulator [Phycisphaerales bacterium]|nr:LexA family transcriptional regulator [Phycisphaerales bacterium]